MQAVLLILLLYLTMEEQRSQVLCVQYDREEEDRDAARWLYGE